MTLRWGILGTGLIARLFTSDLRSVDAPVTAVGSRSLLGAKAFADAWDIPRAHASYEALVTDPDVDVVYVATPHPFHAEHARLALNAGKHVLVEKPFTLNQEEARQIIELARHRGLTILEAMWTRWLPHMVRIREIIAEGTLGELRTLIADHGQRLPTDPSHRVQDPTLGGGALLDLGVYSVSFAWDLFGRPERISAIASLTKTGVDQQTSALLAFPGGRQAVLTTLLDGRGPCTATIIGTEGRIEIGPMWFTPTTFEVFDAANNMIERYESKVIGRGMHFQATAFELLLTDKDHDDGVLPADESVDIMGTLDEIRRQIGLQYPGDS